ncbi:ABC transporter permease [Actinomadura algeriensis]|uniref:ABC-2 type transport system permease protein n=1 Tax=Actinomadura algeriensis TaxID=1679523 RepID=A0ABR9JRH0_9ACTN|nr:ABC transporter permease [Actinomadura algeriensis]MBE1532968.1 ABC-2 type transport system permease protein [Actinomadura algeriensis]
MTPRAYALLTWTEAKLVARDTAGLIVPLALPSLIMVMNGLGTSEPTTAYKGLTAFDGYVLPLTLTMITALIGIVNMPSFLAAYRKTGILRRLSVTPANPLAVLAAQAAVALAHTLLGVTLALLVARFAFDAAPPRAPFTAIAVFALATAAMFAVGLLVAALAPTPNAAVAIGLLLFFATMATGGGFGPPENLPDSLATIGAHLPYGASLEALSATWTGTTPAAGSLAALAATTLICAAAATKTFRWT